MVDISKKTTEIIYNYVQNDLNPPLFQVIWRIALSLVTGGLLSLFFCGQFGIGFSNMAKGWNHAVHAHMGDIPCAILCGAFFSLAPIVILRFLSSGILFRRIVRHYGAAQAALILTAGTSMYFGGSMMNELLNISIWSLSTFLGFKLFGLLVDEASRILIRPLKI